jgi:hypothetical protein
VKTDICTGVREVGFLPPIRQLLTDTTSIVWGEVEKVYLLEFTCGASLWTRLLANGVL